MRLLGILFSPVRAWWRWAGQRQTTRGKVLAYGGPIVALFVIIIIASVAGGGGEDGEGGGEQAAGQPAAATDEPNATAEPVATEAAAAPEATATASLPALSAEECAYVTTVQSQLDTFGDATIKASELMTEPQFFSDDWIFGLAAQLAILQVTADEAAALDPPASLQALHETYGPVAENMTQAAALIADGIDNVDASQIEEATGLFLEATTGMGNMTPQIEAFRAMRSGSC